MGDNSNKSKIYLLILIMFSIIVIFLIRAFLPSEPVPFSIEKERPLITFFAIVAEIDEGSGSMSVVHKDYQEKKIRVLIDEDTELIKLAFPFDLADPPDVETDLKMEEIPASLREFKNGQEVFIKAYIDLEKDNSTKRVVFVQMMP